MIKIKLEGSSPCTLKGLKPETVIGIMIANTISARMFDGRDITLTSVTDSHSPPSLHPEGYAFDLRTRDLSNWNKVEFAKQLVEELGGEWDVVVEKDHIHVEFDPPSLKLKEEEATELRDGKWEEKEEKDGKL